MFKVINVPRFVGAFLMDYNRFEFKPLLSSGMLGSLRHMGCHSLAT